jgi:predicted phosphodiesterase
VLQVSDLHMDPVGFTLEKELAEEFHASFILDAGDVDDYGTPVEAAAIQRFLYRGVPRLFVPGNHESPSIVKAIAGVKGVTVIETSGTVTMDGIRVFGLADPTSHSNGWTPNNEKTLIEAQAAADQLREDEATGSPRPDIIATHNPVGLQPFIGMAPLLVAGHTHTPDMQHWGSSWYINSGTVGGVDFKQLYSDPSIAHGASILYYTDRMPRKLVAIDTIAIAGRVDQSSLKRTVIDPSLLDELIKRQASEAAASAGKAAPGSK